MAVNQGAIQLQIIINNKSLSISKKHLVSLNVKRVIGDSANEFTLEVFDETAYQVENLLIGSAFPSITVKYSSSTSLTKSVIFTGTCLDYNTTFTGRAMMLSITGILMTTGDVTSGWWFDKATIEWCGSEITDYYNEEDDKHEYWIDGKNAATFTQYKDNRDVCAIVVSDENGGCTAYFNPGRIFQRIIHKYNGDKLGSNVVENSSEDNSSTSGSKVSKGKVQDITWNYLRDQGFTQECTAAIMGNIQQESSFNPERLQSGGPAAGLFQWENYTKKTGRWKSLNNFAKKRGKSWTDVPTQLDFMMSELEGCLKTYTGPNGAHGTYKNGTPYGWPSKKLTLSQYKAYKNVNEATEIFSRVFERPSVPRMSKRKQYANNFYKQYKNISSSKDIKEGGVYTTTKKATVRTKALISSSELGTIAKGEKVTALEDSINNWVHISYKQSNKKTLKGYILGACLTEDSLSSTSEESSTKTTKTTETTKTGEIAGWGKGGTGKYKIAECDETKWIANLETIQNNETAAQYITRVLCKAAISDTGKNYADETAGFKYWCDAKGHHFKALNYNSKKIASKINVSYGLKESQIISFSISNLGAVAMVWGDKDKRNSITASSAAMSDLYNDSITAGGEYVLDSNVSKKVLDSTKSTLNWYQDKVPAIKIKSSASESELSATLSNTYEDLTHYCISAELTIWGEYSKGYTPGDYIDIIVMTAGGYKHYSSGIYMITAMEDNISGAGYTQTMRLLKLNKESKVTNAESSSNPSLEVDESGNIIVTYTGTNNITIGNESINTTENHSSGGGGEGSFGGGGGRRRLQIIFRRYLNV